MATRFVRREDLPLFATDEELAVAIVGPVQAKHWAAATVKGLELQPGFPKIDGTQGGRYTPAVRRYYDVMHGIVPWVTLRPAHRPDNMGEWNRPKRPVNSKPKSWGRAVCFSAAQGLQMLAVMRTRGALRE